MNTLRSLTPAPALRLLPLAAILTMAGAGPAFAWPFVKRDMLNVTGAPLRLTVFHADTDRRPEFTMGEQVSHFNGTGYELAPLPLPDPDPYSASDPQVDFDRHKSVAGDLDGDGDTDLVVSCGVYYGTNASSTTADYRIMVCLNDGAGHYTRGWQWKGYDATVFVNEPSLALADMDNDGDLDLVEGFNAVRVRWNPGNGDFGSSSTVLDSINLKGGREDFVSGDFNRDGLTDLVAFGQHVVIDGSDKDFYGRCVLYSGKAGGGFTAQILATLPLGDQYLQAEGHDVDGDGLTDLVFSRGAGPSNIAWMRNNGTGFEAAQVLVLFANYESPRFAIGDLDEDGRADLVYCTDWTRLAWVRGTGGGAFGPEQVLFSDPTGSKLETTVMLADYDADGDLDVLYRHGGTVMENTAIHRDFRASALPWAGTSPGAGKVDLEAAWITGDGRQDLVATDPAGQRILVYPGGNATLTSPLTVSTAGEAPGSVAAGDFDGDGKTDLAWTTGSAVKWARNVNGNGIGWTTQTALTLAGANRVLAGDADNDGDVDLLVSSTSGANVRWLLNNGDGSSWTGEMVATSVPGVERLSVAQTIPGGRPEVEVALSTQSSTATFRRYTYTAGAWSISVGVNQASTAGAPSSLGLTVGRFSQDSRSLSSAFKLGNPGNEVRFHPGATLVTSSSAVTNLASMDWDNDGYDDLFAAGVGGYAFRNTGDTPSNAYFFPDPVANAFPVSADVVPFDLNHDGLTDAVSVEADTGKLQLIYNNSSALTVSPGLPNGESIKLPPGEVATLVKLNVRNWGRTGGDGGKPSDASAVPESCEYTFRRAVLSGSKYIPGTTMTEAEISAVIKSVRFNGISMLPSGTSGGRFTLPLTSFIQASQAVEPHSARDYLLGIELKPTALSGPVTRFFVDAGGSAAAAPRWFPLSNSGEVGSVPLGLDVKSGDESVLIEVTAPTPLQQWRMTNFGTYLSTGTAANDADPDKDGMPNLMEYVTGRNPKAAPASELSDPSIRVLVQTSANVVVDAILATSYDPGVQVTVQKSTSLGSWSDLASRNSDGSWNGVVPLAVPITGGRTRLFFDTGLQPGSTSRCYFRLKAAER